VVVVVVGSTEGECSAAANAAFCSDDRLHSSATSHHVTSSTLCVNVIIINSSLSSAYLADTQWRRHTRCVECVRTPGQENTFLYLISELFRSVRKTCSCWVVRYTNRIATWTSI